MVDGGGSAVNAHASRPPFSLDPLMAEAKRRARRRTFLLVLAMVLVAGAVVGTAVELQPGGAATTLCVSPPSGWRARPAFEQTGFAMTNFRFGRASYDDGLVDYGVRWPQRGIMIEILNWGAARPRFPGRVTARPLQLQRSDLTGLEGFRRPVLRASFRYEGRFVTVTAEFRKASGAAIATANRALAGVRGCTA